MTAPGEDDSHRDDVSSGESDTYEEDVSSGESDTYEEDASSGESGLSSPDSERSGDGRHASPPTEAGTEDHTDTNAGNHPGTNTGDHAGTGERVASTQEQQQGTRGPPQRRGNQDEEPDERLLLVRDIATSVIAVLLIGAYLFAISGVWPPMVAIESGSMEPNMDVNDLVFVMETERFQPDESHEETGIVTAQRGEQTDYKQFGGHGDVIVFAPNGNTEATPVIHRAMYWVEEGENWCEMGNQEYLIGTNEQKCIAEHDGFITKGDNNQVYDQTRSDPPVKPEWIVGTAEAQVPGLGWLRLQLQ